VSLFALIFSIGILVDDAIVVVENIHRCMDARSGTVAGSDHSAAVDEVGGPTILATFTVIAALLPMAFVTGLMGPYMSPIPINASMGMLISLAIAFVVTPWLASAAGGYRRRAHGGDGMSHGRRARTGHAQARCRFFRKIMTPFLAAAKRAARAAAVAGWCSR
jgi:multidrug efflux pump subunit AcrB